jgi:hypothetical protein
MRSILDVVAKKGCRNARSVLGVVVFVVLVVGALTLVMTGDAVAKKPGGPGPCGECPCADPLVLPDGTECYLESCHLLYPKECLWDCHYVCPFPF